MKLKYNNIRNINSILLNCFYDIFKGKFTNEGMMGFMMQAPLVLTSF